VKTRRAFTLIELSISLVLVGLLSSVTMNLFRSWNAIYSSLTLQAQRKMDTRRAALRIFNSTRGGARILPDQRGLALADGGQLRWSEGKLLLRGQSLFHEPLLDFCIIRRDGILHVAFVVEGQVVYQGRKRALRYEYDQGFGQGNL